ncbi:hypothetical protein O6H91_07G052500 [Diphasiastrum complanatum]|nr:hypothetical protein O6H91_07G052500 [Diphasiastrum complanatum]
MEYDVGEFIVRTADELVEVTFSMMEIEGGEWKSGLFLDGAVIRPSYLVPHPVHERTIP